MSDRPGVMTAFDTRQLAETAKEVLDLWWLWLVRGVLAIAFGIAAWVWPGLTITTLIWLVGAYIIVDGILSVIGFFRHGDLSWGRRFLLLFWGIVQVIAGIIIWFAPGLGVVTMMLVFGIWAMLTGMFLVVGAFTRDGHLMSPWIQAIVGILGIVVGISMVVHPGRGALAAIWAIGATAIVYGVFLIITAFRIRSLRNAFVANPRVEAAINR